MVTWTTLGNGDKRAVISGDDGIASIVVPLDYNSSANTIEATGGGGGSYQYGSGGGAYASIVNFVATPGASINISVGTKGLGSNKVSTATSGGDTWFDATTTLLAKGGTKSGSGGGGAGGASTASFGATKFKGGNGSSTPYSGLGGAAATSAGNGANGGETGNPGDGGNANASRGTDGYAGQLVITYTPTASAAQPRSFAYIIL